MGHQLQETSNDKTEQGVKSNGQEPISTNMALTMAVNFPAPVIVIDNDLNAVIQSGQWTDRFGPVPPGSPYYSALPELKGLAHIIDQAIGQMPNPGQPLLDQIEIGELTYEFRCNSYEQAPGKNGVILYAEDISDRIESQQKVSEGYSRYKALYNRTPVMMHSINSEGIIERVSDRWIEKMGFEREEVIGRLSSSFLTEESQKRAKENIAKFYKDGYCRDLPYQFITKNGEVLDILLSATLERDSNGKPLRSLAVLDDVTEVNRRQREIENLNRRLTLALAASNVGVWDWNIAADELIWDDQMYALYGVTKEDFEGAFVAWQQGLHPDDAKAAEENVNQALNNHVKFDTSFRIVWPSGEVRIIRALAEVIRDNDGNAIQMIGVNWDITESQNAQELLELSNERYRLMTAGASVGIWDWMDVSKLEAYWSPRFYELLGYKDKEIENSLENFNDLLHPEDRERTFTMLEDHLAGKGPFDLEYRLRTKSGDYRWYRGAGQVSNDSAGHPTRMVGSIQDVHERVMAEEELKRSNESLDEFTYIASHDLREPLRGMRNFAEFLAEDYGDVLDEKGLGYVSTIRKLGTRLDRYLDSLLYFSRLGRAATASQVTDLNQLMADLHETHIEPSSDDVTLAFPKNLPEMITDRVKLELIFGNLIQNAIRYNSNSAKRIEITYEQPAKGLHQFRIIDNGIGMREENWERIFTIFRRLHGKDEYGGGTGLGLTLVKKAVEKLGGEIYVEKSAPDQGTTIALTLPESILGNTDADEKQMDNGG